MTLFVPPTQTLQLPNSTLQFIPAKSNTFDFMTINLTKDHLPHQDYLNLKKLWLQCKLLNNNFTKAQDIWSSHFLSIKPRIAYQYQITEDTYTINQTLPISADPWSKITEAIPALNPLYHTIDDLPTLHLILMQEYQFEHGFKQKLTLDLNKILGNLKTQMSDPNHNTYTSISNYTWANFNFDFTNTFKITLHAEFSNQRG